MKEPWAELNAMQVVGAVGFQGKRLDLENNKICPEMKELLKRCFSENLRKGRVFSSVARRQRRLRTSFTRRKQCFGAARWTKKNSLPRQQLMLLLNKSREALATRRNTYSTYKLLYSFFVQHFC